MNDDESPLSNYQRLKRRQNECAFCRFTRSLAFSAIGALIGYYGSTQLGANQNNAIICAFAGSLFLVTLITGKKKK